MRTLCVAFGLLFGALLTPAIAGALELSTGATFETYVYRIEGTPQLWFPCAPENARVAYTTVGVVDSLTVGVETHASSPHLTLGPNPAKGRLSINFWLPQRAKVHLEIVDVAGRVVATIVNRDLEEGAHRVKWDGTSAGGAKEPRGNVPVSSEDIWAGRSAEVRGGAWSGN